MADWRRRPVQRFWVTPEQVAAHRACVAFIEWMKRFFDGPLHRAGRLPGDLTIAACEMTLFVGDARTEVVPARRLACFREARRNAESCAALLDAPEALELGSREQLERGHELLRRVLAILDGLIRPPPEGAGAGSPTPGPTSAPAPVQPPPLLLSS